MPRSISFVVAFSCLWAVSASGQGSPQTLSLDDCVRLALTAPSTVTLARQQNDIAGYGVTQARANFLPQFQINNLFAYNSPSRVNPETFSFVALNSIREYTSLFTMSEEVDISGRLRSVLARSRADRDAAATSLQIVQRDLRRAVTASYYQLLLARHTMRIAGDALSEARSFENRVRLLFQSGEAAQADVVKASAQSAFLEQTRQSAELNALLANQDLASFWTSDIKTLLEVVDVFGQQPPTPPSDAEGGAAGAATYFNRLEYRLFDAERRGFLADARQARSHWLPQGSIVFQYGIDSIRMSTSDRGYSAFFNLNIPVFDWFKARDASRQSQLQARQVETQRLIAQRTFSKEYEAALARVKMTYSQVATTQNQVKLSAEDLRLSRVRYEGGEGGALDVVTAQNQLAQAQVNHYAALAAYLNARADLEVASGK
jgi:outer membrane protein